MRYRPRNGIHIMTDTDDTREFATAYYGDIVARSSPSGTMTSTGRTWETDQARKARETCGSRSVLM